MKKERQIGPDILRCAAILLVFLTHYLNYHVTHYLKEGIHSLRWLGAVTVRYSVVQSVPFFLLLTGYLQNKRTPGKKHYASIVPVLLSWLVLSVASVFAARGIWGAGEQTVGQALLSVFDFSFGYTWYVEMYFCLFLIIPFLNILIDHLTDRQYKALILTAVLLTALYDVGRSFRVGGDYFYGFPDYFQVGYCITYYLIGAYIGRYKPCPNRLLCAGTAAVTLCAVVAVNWVYSQGEYAWWIFRGYSSLPHVVISTSVFLLLYRIRRLPRVLSAPIREISVCSFEMYLLSYVTDRFFYGKTTIPLLYDLPVIGRLAEHTYWARGLCSVVCAYLLARLSRLILVPISDRLRNRLTREKLPDGADK